MLFLQPEIWTATHLYGCLVWIGIIFSAAPFSCVETMPCLVPLRRQWLLDELASSLGRRIASYLLTLPRKLPHHAHCSATLFRSTMPYFLFLFITLPESCLCMWHIWLLLLLAPLTLCQSHSSSQAPFLPLKAGPGSSTLFPCSCFCSLIASQWMRSIIIPIVSL